MSEPQFEIVRLSYAMRELGFRFKDGRWARSFFVNPQRMGVQQYLNILRKYDSRGAEIHVSTCEDDEVGNKHRREVVVDLDSTSVSANARNALRAYELLVERGKLFDESDCFFAFSGNKSVYLVCYHSDDLTANQLSSLASLLMCKGVKGLDVGLFRVHCHMRRVIGSINHKSGKRSRFLSIDEVTELAERR